MPAKATLTEDFASRFRQEIRSGRWKPDHRLPSERELAEKFGISRVTVRRSLKRLCAEDLIESRPARGYFVIARPPARGKTGAAHSVLFFHRHGPGPSLDALHTGIINGALDEAHATDLELYLTSQSPAAFRKTIGERWGRDLRGVLLDWARPDLAETMLAANIPFVMVENDIEGLKAAAVIQDNAGGIREALEHMARRGHRKLGLVVNEETGIHPAQRLSGYREFLVRRGLPAEAGWVAFGSHDPAGGRHAAAAILDSASVPTAILLTHRLMLPGVLEELAARKLRVPEDISLAAWGDPEAGEIGSPTDVTYISWSREDMGRLAMRALEDRIRAGRAERMIIRIEAHVVDRGTVAAPAEGR